VPAEAEYATFLRPMGLALDRTGAEGSANPPAWIGRALVDEQLCIPGTDRIRSSVMACWTDIVGGSEANRLAGGRVALTADLTIRLLAPPVADAVVISSRVLKAGRSTIFCEACLTNERGVTFAVSHMTFQTSPRTEDVIAGDGLPGLSRPAEPVAPSYPVPFFDFLGLRHAGDAVVELDRRPAVMNPAATLQGGALAALIEAAAEDVCGPVGEMEIHYLSAVRVGPGRAVAGRLGGDGFTRVEVSDPGNHGRLATLALAWPVSPLR
jgi:acyl-coenzyme A thioesterase PaaI-like protein